MSIKSVYLSIRQNIHFPFLLVKQFFCEGVDVVLRLVILLKKLRTNAASYSLSLSISYDFPLIFQVFPLFCTNGIPFSHYLHRSLSHLYFNLIILILSFHTNISKGTTLEAMT